MREDDARPHHFGADRADVRQGLHRPGWARRGDAAGPRSQGVVQMVFQDPSESLDPHIRIAESVKEPILKGHGSSLPDRVDAALSAVGLDPKLGRQLPHQLSGGQQQRACIAGPSSRNRPLWS